MIGCCRSGGIASPPYEPGELHHQEADSDWTDDIVPEEEDSAAEDSVSISLSVQF